MILRSLGILLTFAQAPGGQSSPADRLLRYYFASDPLCVSRPGHRYRIPSPEEARAQQALDKEEEWLLWTCKGLKERGQWGIMRNTLQASRPERFHSEVIDNLLADADIRIGDYAGALGVLSRYRVSSLERETQLRLSLAVSLLGDAFPGQRKICVGWMQGSPEAVTDPILKDALSYFPGDFPNGSMYVSCLALGFQISLKDPNSSLYYLARANELAPNNPLAAFMSGLAFQRAKTPMDARARVLEAALNNCHPGALKDAISRDLLWYRTAPVDR